jgi:hypothetical protein
MEGKRRPVGVSKAAATPLCPFFLSILLTSLLLAQPPHSVQHTSHLRAAEQGATPQYREVFALVGARNNQRPRI